MQIQRFDDVDAFIVRDLDGAPAGGVVRCAPKILVDGGQWLARSFTYRFASFGQMRSGASAGVNAAPPDRAAALATFTGAIRADVAGGALALEPGRGVTGPAAEALQSIDLRSDVWWSERHVLTAAGIVAAATSAESLDGRSVAVEGIDAMGPDLASAVLDELTSAGASVTAVTAGTNGVAAASGLDPAALRLVAAGSADLTGLGDDIGAEAALAAPVEVMLAGSRAGVLGHALAREISARAVVPWGPLPVTAKALAELTRRGCVVLPDFVTTAGPSIVASDVADVSAVRDEVRAAVAAAIGEVLGHEDGPLLGACLRAEAFLATWCDDLPFGRPIA